MALINCPECGHQVSSYAEACPECGCPVSEATAAAAQSAAQEAPVVASVPTAGAKAPIDPGHTPVTPDAGSIVVEFPGPNPMWTTLPKWQLEGCGQPWDIQWGKTVRLSSDTPVTLKVVNSVGVIVCRVVAVAVFLLSWIALGATGQAFAGFMVGAIMGLLYFGVSFVAGNEVVFLAMPGKRYKLYWEKKIGNYKLKAQEVPI